MNKRTLKKLLEEMPDGCLDEAELDFGPDVGEEAVWDDEVSKQNLSKLVASLERYGKLTKAESRFFSKDLKVIKKSKSKPS